MPMTNQEYIEKGGQYCPFCESSDIQTTSGFDMGTLNIWQSCECRDCGKKWNDVYALVNYEELEED